MGAVEGGLEGSADVTRMPDGGTHKMRNKYKDKRANRAGPYIICKRTTEQALPSIPYPQKGNPISPWPASPQSAPSWKVWKHRSTHNRCISVPPMHFRRGLRKIRRTVRSQKYQAVHFSLPRTGLAARVRIAGPERPLVPLLVIGSPVASCHILASRCPG